MFFMTYGFNFDDTNIAFNKNIIKHPKVLDAELPVGQFTLRQPLPVSRLDRRLVTQVFIDCPKDYALVEFAIGTNVVGGSLC